MSIYSGKIGDIIEFNALNAGSVTGVKFGASAISKNFKIQPDLSTVLARVPTDAYWGQVSFYKTPINNVYNVVGSGYAKSGALSDLQSKLTSLNLYSSNCTSGDITYTNTYEATALCDLKATGKAKAETSGILYDAYGSGWCGDNTNGFTSSGYSASNTRLHDFSMFQDNSGNWLALGFVQNTGDFIYQTAKLDVTCVETSVETTPHSFVPVPLITNFNPKEASQGNSLRIAGNAFFGVSDVRINNVQVPHVVTSNYEITGTIPAGTFAHKIQITGPSGVKANSLNEFVTFSPLAGATLNRNLTLASGRSLTVNKGYTGTVSILGDNVSGITLAQLTDQNSIHTNILSDPTFGFTPNTVYFSPQNLQVGKYDLTVGNPINNAFLSGAINIIGTPSFSYSYNKVSTINLINEPSTYSDRASLQDTFLNKTYEFSTSQDAEQFCLRFDNASNDGSTSYNLQKAITNPNSTHVDKYFIRGTGEYIQQARVTAAAKWASGIYTTDFNGNHYDSYSEKLKKCICEITNSGDALYGYDEGATALSFFATGLAQTGNDLAIKAQNQNSIDTQAAAYPLYTLVSTTHFSSNETKSYSFSSGINYPFPTTTLNSCSNPFWDPLYASGKAQLYPHGDWENSASGLVNSGCSWTDSIDFNNSPVATLSGVGKTEFLALQSVSLQREANYYGCRTGLYEYSVVSHNGSAANSGAMYGYCSGVVEQVGDTPSECTISGAMSGVLTGVIKTTKEELSGLYLNYTITSSSVQTGVRVGSFPICTVAGTGVDQASADSSRADYSQKFYDSGVCINDLQGTRSTININNNPISFSSPTTGNDGLTYWSEATGIGSREWFVKYMPSFTGQRTKLVAEIECPESTTANVTLNRNEITHVASGLATKSAGWDGWITTLDVSCTTATNGYENHCSIDVPYNGSGCWEGNFEAGNYRLAYRSGSYIDSNNLHFIGVGNLTVNKYE